MTSTVSQKQCPRCGVENETWAEHCRECNAAIRDAGLSQFEQEQATSRRYRTARRVVWSIALAIIALTAFDTWVTLQTSTDISAPQQAAGAAMGLFYSATPYMFARGIDAILR